MIARIITLLLALSSNLISPLFAGTERGDHLITEGGGLQGIAGVAGPLGSPGIAGAAGAAGIQGVTGIPGAPGILGFADFYALEGGGFTDNVSIAVSTGPGTGAVQFPRNGSSSGTITRSALQSGANSSFNLPTVGTYLVLFQVTVSEAGQLMLRLNGSLVPTANSVASRATGFSQITGMSLVTTSTINSVLEVINPDGNSPALTVPANNGGTHPISAHIIIIRIQ